MANNDKSSPEYEDFIFVKPTSLVSTEKKPVGFSTKEITYTGGNDDTEWKKERIDRQIRKPNHSK